MAAAPFEGGTTLKPSAGTKTLLPNEPLEVLILKVVVNPGLASRSEADTDGKKARAGEYPVLICRTLDPDAGSFLIFKS